MPSDPESLEEPPRAQETQTDDKDNVSRNSLDDDVSHLLYISLIMLKLNSLLEIYGYR